MTPDLERLRTTAAPMVAAVVAARGGDQERYRDASKRLDEFCKANGVVCESNPKDGSFRLYVRGELLWLVLLHGGPADGKAYELAPAGWRRHEWRLERVRAGAGARRAGGPVRAGAGRHDTFQGTLTHD